MTTGRRVARVCGFCWARQEPTDLRSWWVWPTPGFTFTPTGTDPVSTDALIACADCNRDVYRRHWATILDRLAPWAAAHRLARMNEQDRAIALRLAREGHDNQLEMSPQDRDLAAAYLIEAERHLWTTPTRLDLVGRGG